jgi:hypothetical protein
MSLAGFVAAIAQDTPKAIQIITGALAGIFALPWLLMLLAGLIQGLMPMGMKLGEIGSYAGSINDVPHYRVSEFRAKPLLRRLGVVHGWAAVNAIVAAILLAIGLGVIYAVSNMKN